MSLLHVDATVGLKPSVLFEYMVNDLVKCVQIYFIYFFEKYEFFKD